MSLTLFCVFQFSEQFKLSIFLVLLKQNDYAIMIINDCIYKLLMALQLTPRTVPTSTIHFLLSFGKKIQKRLSLLQCSSTLSLEICFWEVGPGWKYI